MKNKLYLVTVKDLEIPTMEVKMRYCVETDNVNKIKDYFKHENRKIVSIEEDLRAKQKGQYLYIDWEVIYESVWYYRLWSDRL